MPLRIGFFSLQDHVGCTRIAIHVANHIAGGEKTVAIIEPHTVSDPEFSTAKADFAEDGTFIANNVHYYPAEVEIEPVEEICIYDFGKIDILHEFHGQYDKLYLCTPGDEENVEDIQDYLLDSETECDLILMGASKEQLAVYKSYGFRCVNVPNRKESLCPYELALQINIILRQHQVIPPEYHKDWTYDEIQFHYEPEEEKKSLFGGLFGNKKKETEKEQEDQPDPVPQQEQTNNDNNVPDVSVAAYKQTREANLFKDNTFTPVPVPKPVVKPKETSTEQVKAKKTVVNLAPKQKEPKESIFKKVFTAVSDQREAIKQQKTEKELERLRYEKSHDMLTDCKNAETFHTDIADMKAYALFFFTVNDYNFMKNAFGEKKTNELLVVIAKSLKRHFVEVYRMDEYEFAALIHGGTINETERYELELKKLDTFMTKKTNGSKDLIYQVSHGFAFSTEGTYEVIASTAHKRMEEDSVEKEVIIETIKAARLENEEKKVEEAKQAEEKKLEKYAEKAEAKRKSLVVNPKKTVFMGHISVFVTSLRHSCGSSYTSGSIATAMTDIYDRNVHIMHKSDTPLPDNYMVKEIRTESDLMDAIRSGLIVYDQGLYEELDEKAKENLLRADLRIMVSTADEFDLEKLSLFISEQKSAAYDWLYVFDHVQKKQEKEILSTMDGFSVLLLPQHDYAELPANLRKEWKKAIEWGINSFR